MSSVLLPKFGAALWTRRVGRILAAAGGVFAFASGPAAGAAAAASWFASWEVPAQFAAQGADFGGYTVREIVHATIGGGQARARISNLYGTVPLVIGAAHIAALSGPNIISGSTDTAFTFGGAAGVTIPPGASALSDPAVFTVAPNTNYAVSLYTPVSTGAPTSNGFYIHPSYIAFGNQVSSAALSGAVSAGTASYFLTGLDVAASPMSVGIVAVGDSITAGFGATADSDTSWPSVLASILIGRYGNLVAVANAGIGANKLLSDVAVNNNQNALSRLERDVLCLPGVKQIILAEGINDINAAGTSPAPTAEDVIAGMKQVINKAREAGIAIIGATITPSGGLSYANGVPEGKRQIINTFIRTSGAFDLVLDFDAAVRDPKNLAALLPAYDSGDHLHPNSAGYRAMAAMYPLY